MANDVYELIGQQLGCRVEPVLDIGPAQLTAADQILSKQDPHIIAWSFCNLGAAAVILRPMGAASAAAGFNVPPSGVLSLDWRDDQVLPALEWHAISPGGNQAYTFVALRIVDSVPSEQ